MKKILRIPVMFIENHTGLFWFLVSLLLVWASYAIKDEQTSTLIIGVFILTIITSLIYFITWIADLWDEICDWVNK